MNRCFKTLHHTLLLAAGLTLAHATAMAQTVVLSAPTTEPSVQPAVRPFPPAALRGTLVVTQPPNIQIDGKPERLSPGARIHGANNMLVLSAALTGQQLLVNFVREPQGLVHEVWILTAAEATLPQALATPHPYSR